MNIYNPDNLPVIPARPKPPARPADGAIAICGACGIRVLPIMGYSCGKSDCPIFPQVRC